MKKLLKSGLHMSTALSVVATGFLAAPAMAADDEGFEAIVVTATRREERLQDVAISMTVFNQEQLSNANVTNSSDLAAYTPSLSADTRYGSENSTFSIRGFTQEIRTAPSVGVFFADVVAPRSGGSGLPAGDGAGPGNLFDLQNVQVLKGPQGTLFGRNTTGGDVLMVPVKPKNEFGGYIEGSIGNYDMRRLQGVLNLPVSDTMRLRLGLDHQKRDGYLKNLGSGPDLADTNYTALRASFVWDITPDIENYTIVSYLNSDRNGMTPRIDWYNQDAIDAYNNTPNLRNALAAVVPLAAQEQVERGGGFWTVDSSFENPRNFTEQWQVINTTTWSASDNLTVKNIASYSEFRQKNFSDLWGTNFTVPSVPEVIVPGAVGDPLRTASSTPAPGQYSAAQKNITQELQFQGRELDGRLTWQAGAYMELSNPIETNGSLGTSYVNCPQPLSMDNLDQCLNPYAMDGSNNSYGGGATLTAGWQKYRDYALYAQATYELTDTLKFTGGFRYTWDKTIGMGQNINYVYTVPTADGYAADTSAPENWQHCANANASLDNGCRQVLTQNSSAPTWMLELQYNPTSSTMTYAKYSRGYRQGGVLPVAPAGLDVYDSETVDAYEIGAKTSWRGAVPGMLDIAVFYNDFRNQQLQMGLVPCPQTLCPGSTTYIGGVRSTAIVNAGSSRIYGVEVNTSVSPFQGFRLSVAYSYLNSLLKEFDTDEAVAIAAANGMLSAPTTAEGEALPQTPKHKASFNASYKLPIPNHIGDVTIGGTFVWSGRYLTTAPITASTPGGSEEPYSDETKLVNLNLNWDRVAGSQIDASFFVTNLFNEKIITWRGGRVSGFQNVYANEPRMYGMRLRYSF